MGNQKHRGCNCTMCTFMCPIYWGCHAGDLHWPGQSELYEYQCPAYIDHTPAKCSPVPHQLIHVFASVFVSLATTVLKDIFPEIEG